MINRIDTLDIILKASDMNGVMLPNCRNADMAREFVGHCKYAPEGHRGISVMRGRCGYNAVSNSPEFMKQKNEATLVIIQIESPEDQENVDKIMAVPGVDVALIGPTTSAPALA